VTRVTPAGTVKLCNAPVNEHVTVAVDPDTTAAGHALTAAPAEPAHPSTASTPTTHATPTRRAANPLPRTNTTPTHPTTDRDTLSTPLPTIASTANTRQPLRTSPRPNPHKQNPRNYKPTLNTPANRTNHRHREPPGIDGASRPRAVACYPSGRANLSGRTNSLRGRRSPVSLSPPT
jgi:hypothetical protein